MDETAIPESQSNDDAVVAGEVSSVQVDQAEQKGGQGKGRETERSRVGEFAALDRAVETRLEFTTKGRKHVPASSAHMSKRPVAEAGRLLGGGLFLMAHASSGFFELLGTGIAIGAIDSSVAVGCSKSGGVVEVGMLLSGRHDRLDADVVVDLW